MKHSLLIFSIAATVLFACGPGAQTQKNTIENPSTSIRNEFPGYIVYKTRGDYSKLVVVVLTHDKKTIASIPSPSDLLVDGRFLYPEKLAQGYILGRHGIGPQSAFLKWDYEEFCQKGALLSEAELKDLILDDDPFLEMYNCITRIEESAAIEYFNGLINNGKLHDECTRLK